MNKDEFNVQCEIMFNSGSILKILVRNEDAQVLANMIYNGPERYKRAQTPKIKDGMVQKLFLSPSKVEYIIIDPTNMPVKY